jgi:hypothetical protein
MITSLQRLAAGVGLSLLAATVALAQTATQNGTTAQGTTTQGTTAQGTTGTAPQPAAPAGDPVVAIVNGQTLHRSDVVASAQSLPPQYRDKVDEYFPALVDRLIDITLIRRGTSRSCRTIPRSRRWSPPMRTRRSARCCCAAS